MRGTIHRVTADAPRPKDDALTVVGLVLASWTLLSLGITVLNGHYRFKALVVVVVGLLLLIGAVAALRRSSGWSPSELRAGLAVAAGASLAVSLSYDIGLYGSGELLVRSRGLAVLAAGLAVAAVLLPAAWRPVAAVPAIVTATAGLVAMVLSSPRPAIDVWFILTEGSRRMVAGDNVFTSCWPGNTDRLTDCVYPYLPMTTVVQTPFRVLLGDVRYSYIAALLVVATLLWVLGGNRWGPPLAALVLVSPKLPFLVEQAWTEPLLLVGLTVMVWAVLSGRTLVAVLALAFALACKQHVLLLLPLAAWWPQFGLRRTAVSAGLASLVTLPWFLADPRAFLDDALLFNLELEPRLDSLSLFTAAMNSGFRPPFALVGGLTLLAIAAALVLLPRTATGFVVGAALVQYVFDVLNKQSFFNHWWFVSGLLLLAVATAVHERTPLDEPDHRLVDELV